MRLRRIDDENTESARRSPLKQFKAEHRVIAIIVDVDARHLGRADMRQSDLLKMR